MDNSKKRLNKAVIFIFKLWVTCGYHVDNFFYFFVKVCHSFYYMAEEIKNGIKKLLYIFAVAGASAVIASLQNWITAHGASCPLTVTPAEAMTVGGAMAIGAHYLHPSNWKGIM